MAADKKEATLWLKIKTSGEDALDKVAAGFDKIKEVGGAALAAIGFAVFESIKNFREQEEATNSLSRAMINNGIYTKALKDEYLQQASALQKLTTFGDEQIIGAQGILQGYLGQTKVSKELLQATLDLAAAKKMDLSSAAELVGKTIGTETNALARNGVEVAANASKQEKLGQVIDGINGKWKGQAETAAQGLGVIKQLENMFSDILETVGERLVPVITLFTGKLRGLGSDTQLVNQLIEGFIGTLHVLTNVGNIIGGVFEAVAKVLAIGLAGSIQAVTAILNGQFKQAFEISKMAAEESGTAITNSYKSTKDRMLEIDAAFLAGKQENLALEEEMEAEARTRQTEAKQLARDEEYIKATEDRLLQQEQELAIVQAHEDNLSRTQLDQRKKHLQNMLNETTSAHKKAQIMNELAAVNEKIIEDAKNKNLVRMREETGATIATLSQSNNKSLAAIGKAAAITQIAIDTPVAISKALAAFPPPFSFVAAGLVGAAMAAQAARIAGVPLAEGGIVMPRPGGIQATIGEGGQPEAVIPLDRAGEFGMGGGGTTIIIKSYGGILGNESEAREFAIAVDRQLLELRRNNESVAFDEGFT